MMAVIFIAVTSAHAQTYGFPIRKLKTYCVPSELMDFARCNTRPQTVEINPKTKLPGGTQNHLKTLKYTGFFVSTTLVSTASLKLAQQLSATQAPSPASAPSSVYIFLFL